MRVEKVYFKAEDGIELFGLLHTSEDKSEKEVVISTHGMGSNCYKKRDDVIANKLTDNGISFFSYNNRGSELITTVRNGREKIMQGTVFEDVVDSYYDIVAAIKMLISKGYEKIHLQGHSLGSTKTVYTYNKLLENSKTEILERIKSVILLSLVDISEVMNYLVEDNKGINVLEQALQKEAEGDLDYIIKTHTSFMPIVSPKTLLRYYRDNSEIDFAKYSTPNYEFRTLNNIKEPIFMRWGNVNELISLPADKLSELVQNKLENPVKDISYIDGATHNYKDKEDILADQILKFIKNKVI